MGESVLERLLNFAREEEFYTVILTERDAIGGKFLEVILRKVSLGETEYRLSTVKGSSGRLKTKTGRWFVNRRVRNVTVAVAISPTNGLVFHDSTIVGGMSAQIFTDFLLLVRLRLDPDDTYNFIYVCIIFTYDGAPAHRYPRNPGSNSELKILPLDSSFLNNVEQALSCLRAAVKARPEIQAQMNNRNEVRRQSTSLGSYRTELLLQALEHNIRTITAAKCGQWFRLMQTDIFFSMLK